MKQTLQRLPRLTDPQKDQMVRMFDVCKLSLREIGAVFGRSPTSVHHVLRERGVDTSKAVGCHVQVVCHWCEKSFDMTRSRLRASKKRHFCSTDCYQDWLKEIGNDYLPNRQGQRRARDVVAEHYGKLKPGWVVHHIDKSANNNHPSNLMLFASQADHIRWHRGMDHVKPLWSGEPI